MTTGVRIQLGVLTSATLFEKEPNQFYVLRNTSQNPKKQFDQSYVQDVIDKFQV